MALDVSVSTSGLCGVLILLWLSALAACPNDVNLGKLPGSGTQGETSSTGPAPTTSAAETTGTGTTGSAPTDKTTGCETSCVGPPRVVFVSSQLYTGNLGGLAGADAKCQALADAVKLPGTYMAWLSDNSGSPATRMTRSTGPYVLPDGTQVAADWADLVDGMLDVPIGMTEQLGTPPLGSETCEDEKPSVWTNTGADGKQIAADESCYNWTNTRGISTWGRADTSDFFWTSSCGPIPCQWPGLLYCFEQ